MELFFPTMSIILGCVALLLLLQWKNFRGPPCIGGWIPWIGAAFEFGKAPLEFIEKARIKYGPIFTVFIMGKRMTFVTEEVGIDVFLRSKKVDFELAVQTPIYRTVSVPGNIFFALHEKLYIMMKGKMGALNLYHFNEQLTEELHRQLEKLGSHGTTDLNNLVRSWSQSKKWLLALLEENLPETRLYKPTKDNPMIAFWTLAFILSHPEVHKTIMEDMVSVLGPAGKEKIKISEDDLKKLMLIKWCILETIRLRAPGVITRMVVEPIRILNYTVPPGDLLMLSPFWLHRNPEYFPEPDSFKPERWKKANLEKHAFLDNFLAFGYGKYQCPGRWLALLEIQICIILIFYKYDCHLLDPLPKQSFLHLVGVPHPERQCRIEYRQRK
ncbi:24-hydroxycholesterol 7-alpha-hydroxylase [Echinops telfairi]|uniref:24-hydroxycholesterol 7-alpha-hydroxylase n=1 Tax=Echinops telfairi TaxID=9371 RepID=A0ABM0IYN0_ECHTE|nr:24-hydroxycholesterol 7-alpha-hydroxylase [Echinops telfairi]